VQAPPQEVKVASIAAEKGMPTGSSKLATVRRWTPKTWQKATQNDLASASSRVSSFHSFAKAMARCLISFHERGIGAHRAAGSGRNDKVGWHESETARQALSGRRDIGSLVKSWSPNSIWWNRTILTPRTASSFVRGRYCLWS